MHEGNGTPSGNYKEKDVGDVDWNSVSSHYYSQDEMKSQ